MNTTFKLPKRKHFYSNIQEESVSIKDYLFAKKVWKKFKCKNLTEYAEIYCSVDVLILAEIMQKFRSTMMDFANLDPIHYISLPGFGFDTMLKLTNCEIELPTNIDQIQLLQSGIRGGISFINTRYKSVESNLEKSSESIMYIDANNLYGHAQTGKLPYSNYEWVCDFDIDTFDVTKIDCDSDEGYILEVDLEYPKKLHYLHNDYPLAPEMNEIKWEDLSPYSKKYCDSLNYKSKKLVTSFRKKEKYIVHVKNLKLYVQLGLKITKIHRILKFKQVNFLLPFIEKCTEARKNAKSVFEKNLYKLISNSCYGKFIENARDYINLRIHQNVESFRKATSQHTFKSYSIIDENLVTTSHFLPEITHNKAYAIGFTILEYSKHFMYDFYYNKLLKKCGKENIELLFTDTDSFCFYVKDRNIFNYEMSDYMDYSNYSEEHPFFDDSNKAQLGYFKDEIDSFSRCLQFVGLRSKCYALKIKNENSKLYSEKLTAKGLGKVAIKNRLKFDQYKKCLFENKDIRHYYTGIVSKKQNLFTVVRSKKALSCFDSKRYILPCGIHTMPLNSTLIKKHKGKCLKC